MGKINYPAFTERAYAHEELHASDVYAEFVEHKCDISHFREMLVRQYIKGCPKDQVNKWIFYARIQQDEKTFVEAFLRGYFNTLDADMKEYDEEYTAYLNSILSADFSTHYKTFIYPEESRLLYYLTRVLRPRKVLVLGSYFGFWASFCVSAMSKYFHGQIDLFDVDADVSTVSKQLFTSVLPNCGVDVNFYNSNILDDVSDLGSNYDLVILDAETPLDHPDPELRDKAIYAPLIRQVIPHLSTDSVLVAHNILFSDQTGIPELSAKAEYNRQNMGGFMELMKERATFSVEVPTTEGVGIYGISGECVRQD